MGHIIFSQEIPLNIKPLSVNLPVAPNNYGYWAYDNTDVGFDQKPDFFWVELDPSYGGINGTHYQLNDEDHDAVQSQKEVQL